MVDDVRIIDWIFAGLGAALSIAIKWVIGDMKEDIKNIEMDGQKTSLELANFRLHVSDNFPNQRTMERLYETIETMAKDVNDLKVMIGRKSN